MLEDHIDLTQRVKYALLKTYLDSGVSIKEWSRKSGLSRRKIRKFILTACEIDLTIVSDLAFGLDRKAEIKFVDKKHETRYFDGTGEHEG